MSSNLNIAILGSGSFGTALTKVISENGYKVNWWVRDSETAKHINDTKHHTKYLTHIKFSDNVEVMTNIEDVVKSSDLVFIVVPSQVSIDVVKEASKYVNNSTNFVSTIKGFAKTDELLLSRVFKNILKSRRLNNSTVSVLSGPNLAREIIEGNYTGTVIASNNMEINLLVQKVLQNNSLKVVLSDDISGVEIGGTLKNIYAIAAGIVDHLHEGANCKSLMMAMSIQEMISFAKLFNAKIQTLTSISGVGDLFTTCTSDLSRNHRLGMVIASGLPIKEARAVIGGVSEGYETLMIAKEKVDKENLDMPILNSVYKVFTGEIVAGDFVESWFRCIS